MGVVHSQSQAVKDPRHQQPPPGQSRARSRFRPLLEAQRPARPLPPPTEHCQQGSGQQRQIQSVNFGHSRIGPQSPGKNRRSVPPPEPRATPDRCRPTGCRLNRWPSGLASLPVPSPPELSFSFPPTSGSTRFSFFQAPRTLRPVILPGWPLLLARLGNWSSHPHLPG